MKKNQLVGITGTDAERCAREIFWDRFGFYLLEIGDGQFWDAAYAMLSDSDHVVSVVRDDDEARHVRACGGVVLHVGGPSGVAASDTDFVALDANAEIVAFLKGRGLCERGAVIEQPDTLPTLCERFNEVEAHLDVITGELFGGTTKGELNRTVAELNRALATLKKRTIALARSEVANL